MEAIENSYQEQIDALEQFLDDQEYLIDKAGREGAQTFEELRAALAEYGLDSAEYLSQATDWLNTYNSALSELNNTMSEITSTSTGITTDGLIYSSSVQDRINQALSDTLSDIATTTGLTLSDVSYDSLTGSSGNQTIYINSLELPNVQDIDDFVAALKELPNLATSSSSQRT